MPGVRFKQLAEAAKQHVREITVSDVQQKLYRGAACRLIDVREDHEWAGGHMPGAIHLGRGVIERDIEEQVPDVQTELILYCGGGSRSALAAENLQKMGYQAVWSMQGGMKAWLEAGLSLEGTAE
jgi:rhodanese-related sulfurtransferase